MLIIQNIKDEQEKNKQNLKLIKECLWPHKIK